MFVDWFPLLFGTSFVVSLLVSEVRNRGHLKLGRDPKRSGIIGLLIILGFNFIVAGPILIAGLLIEYTIGAPSTIFMAMYAIMALTTLIPILLSGIVSYFIINGIYNNWGIARTVAIPTLILFILMMSDYVGWLQASMPFIIEMVGSMVEGLFSFLIAMVFLAICLGKCTPSDAKTDNEETSPNKNLGNISIESGLHLLVRLGRRIVNDSDEDALKALQMIYSYNIYSRKALTQASKEIDIDLDSILSREDVLYSQQLLEVVNGQFGKLEKRIRNIIISFLIIGVISAILTVILFTLRIYVGMFLFIPAIILPVIGGAAYQENSRFDKGRFALPSVSQYNSFLLSEKEFRARVVRDRVIFSLSLLSLLGIIGISAFGLVPSYLIWGGVACFILILTSTLSVNDRTLSSKRLKTPEIVERGLKFIGVKEDDEILEDQVQSIKLPYEERYSEPETKPLISEDWRIRLEQQGHSDFAKKVANRDREVYEETSTVIIYMIIGGMISFFGFATYFMFLEIGFLVSGLILPIGLVVVGFPIFLFGTYKYSKSRKSTRLNGMQRKQLTILLSHFDQKAQGVADFGSMTDIHAPSEYLNYGISRIFISIIIRSAIIKLRHRVPWPKEEIAKVWKTRSSYPKLEIIAFIVSSLILILVYHVISLIPDYLFPELLQLLFLSIIGFIVLTSINSIITYYREKRLLIEILGSVTEDTRGTYPEVEKILFNLIQTEFAMPLRVLLVGTYPQATYTGRSYFTTTGIEVREAVIIPHGPGIER